jgi:hypothetical protein
VISLSYNSKAIKTDVNAKPIPQYFNPVTDEYEALQGTGGAARQVLYGSDGQPISVADNKLAVKASELETLLNTLTGKDFATQTTLAEVLIALGSQSTAAKQDALAGLVGALDSAAVSDPAAAGAVIALLKGLLSRLQTLENKIDSFTTGEETVNTELKGSLVAYDSTHDAIKTVNASLLHESFDFKDAKKVTVSPGSYLYDTYRPTNGYAQARIIAKRIGEAHNWRLNANWSSVNDPMYQVVEELHTASLTDTGTQTAKIVTTVGSQWLSLQLFNDDAENSHDYHVHIMLTAG